jgi:hypothetical protein
LRLPPLEGVGRCTGQELIDPEDADHPTIHGLCGTGILAHDEQATRLTKSPIHRHVAPERGARFKDQMKVAADGQKRLRLVNILDVSK